MIVRMLISAALVLVPLTTYAQNSGEVSFYKQIRPILQRRCQGCHQPVAQGGKMILTTYEAFRAGGSNGPGFVPGKPESSIVMRNIVGNPPPMPKNQKPLTDAEVDLFRKWIEEGAK